MLFFTQIILLKSIGIHHVRGMVTRILMVIIMDRSSSIDGSIGVIIGIGGG